LRSTSVIQKIKYSASKISITTFDNSSDIIIRMNAKPRTIELIGIKLKEINKPGSEGFIWKQLNNGGVLKIHYNSGNALVVLK
jgi:hypothetical protein